MKHIVKLLMVTFLLSSVGIVYAQDKADMVDKNKDESVKVKHSGFNSEKGDKGSNAGRLTEDTKEPTKGSGDETAIEGKKSFFGRLFGGKSAPEGHSSKASASSRGGSAKTKSGDKKQSASTISSEAPAKDKEQEVKPQGDGGDDGN